MAGVFIRGGKSGSVLVLIDGVQVNDPSNPDRSFDFGSLTTDNVERIEVLRGPQTVIYGSDATGGVIKIITKKGKGAGSLGYGFETGSYLTFKEKVSLAGATDSFNYSIAASRFYSNGIPKVLENSESGSVIKPTNKPYNNTTGSTRLGYNLFSGTWINFAMHYTDSMAKIPQDAYYDQPNRRNYSTSVSAMTDVNQQFSDWWSHTLKFSFSNSKRRDKGEPFAGALPGMLIAVDSEYKGSIRKADWQHKFSFGTMEEIIVGADVKQERGSSDSIIDMGYGATKTVLDEKTVVTKGVYAQNHLNLWERYFLTAGGRFDRHEFFGNEFNYGVSQIIVVPFLETRIKGNYGTGFKAPTISQLYDTYSGNKNLKPEKNKSYDAGFEQPLWNDVLSVEVIYFKNNFTNMILTSNAPPYKNVNAGKVETSGVEGSFKLSLPASFMLVLNYTYTKTEDLVKKKELLRRPKHQLSANVDWAFLEDANLNVNINYVGKQKDYWYNYSEGMFGTTKYVTNDDYTVIDLKLSYKLYDSLTAYGKVLNITNEKYQSVAGYRAPGVNFYAGLEGTL